MTINPETKPDADEELTDLDAIDTALAGRVVADTAWTPAYIKQIQQAIEQELRRRCYKCHRFGGQQLDTDVVRLSDWRTFRFHCTLCGTDRHVQRDQLGHPPHEPNGHGHGWPMPPP